MATISSAVCRVKRATGVKRVGDFSLRESGGSEGTYGGRDPRSVGRGVVDGSILGRERPGGSATGAALAATACGGAGFRICLLIALEEFAIIVWPGYASP